MTDVLLATCAALPDGEPGGHLLLEELAARGVAARWVRWDDADVDWGGARLVAVRSTWDYEDDRVGFVGWAHRVAAAARLVNGARVLEWNTDKAYLLDLAAAGLPVVPTVSVDEPGDLAEAVSAWPTVVVKPRVGAGGRGVRVLDRAPDGVADGVADGAAGAAVSVAEDLSGIRGEGGPWVVQPLVASVRTEGETSVFVLGGEVVAQVVKRPSVGEIRVHEEHGGRSEPAPVTEEAAALALRTVAEAERLLAEPLPVARVDLMRADDGTLLVSELEVTEPGLYLDVVPDVAGAYAAVLHRLVNEELRPGT